MTLVVRQPGTTVILYCPDRARRSFRFPQQGLAGRSPAGPRWHVRWCPAGEDSAVASYGLADGQTAVKRSPCAARAWVYVDVAAVTGGSRRCDKQRRASSGGIVIGASDATYQPKAPKRSGARYPSSHGRLATDRQQEPGYAGRCRSSAAGSGSRRFTAHVGERRQRPGGSQVLRRWRTKRSCSRGGFSAAELVVPIPSGD